MNQRTYSPVGFFIAPLYIDVGVLARTVAFAVLPISIYICLH